MKDERKRAAGAMLLLLSVVTRAQEVSRQSYDAIRRNGSKTPGANKHRADTARLKVRSMIPSRTIHSAPHRLHSSLLCRRTRYRRQCLILQGLS